MRHKHMRGFTLIEMIVAMVVLAIVGGMVAVFISVPARSYSDSVARAELTDVADTALRRMARDIRLALPNSVRIQGGVIEMLLTRTGGRYLAAEDGAPVTTPVLDFLRPGNKTFTVLGHVDSTGRQAITAGDRVVVFNLGPGFDYADAYGAGNSATVEEYVAATKLVKLQSNPFASDLHPPLQSPNARFHVVREAVRYTCVAGAGGSGTLTRRSGYGWQSNIGDAVTGGINALAADKVAACNFSIVSLGATRASLVFLSLTLQTPGSADGPITLTHQLHIDNTP
jgi:MSHA biogenesis protein MshO